MLRLLIEDSEGKSKLAPINPDGADITIGRKEGNIIRLKERNVSRQHARIYSTPDGLFVEPVAARYGMKVNSSKITGPTQIDLGDEIVIGDYRLYIQDENKPQVKREEEASDQVMPIAPVMQPRFVVVSSNFAGREYSVTQTKVTIGRQPSCEICIEHQSVSANHAEIERNSRGGFMIRDLGSSNGTKINGIELNQAVHELMSGDMVILGHVMMRFCAPGELWYFNFGGFEDHKRSTPTNIIMIFVIVILAIVGSVIGTLVYVNNNTAKPQQEVRIQKVDEQDETKLLSLILDCGSETKAGNFEKAQRFCDKALEINPQDSRLIVAVDTLRREVTANADLQEAQDFIQEGRCREALNGLEAVPIGTWAYQQMMSNDIQSKAVDCMETMLFNRAIESIGTNNLTEAELALDELRRLKPESPMLKDASDQIKSKRGSGSSAGTRSNSGTRTPSTTSAPSAPKGDVSELLSRFNSSKNLSEKKRIGLEILKIDSKNEKVLCSLATIAKIEKNPCEAFKYFKRVTNASDGNCRSAANTHVQQYAGECK